MFKMQIKPSTDKTTYHSKEKPFQCRCESLMMANKELLTCRRILCIMIITCFMNHYMIRVNMSISIVEMLANSSNLTSPGPTFPWSETQKNDILGCFFWGFLLTPIPGGRLSETYGTRRVLGVAMFVSSILTIATPFACYLHYYCAVGVRVALGVMLGVSWPSIPPLAMKWVAPEDASSFMSHTIACGLGAGLILPVCGYVIAYLGWPSVFYITGGLSLLWAMFWFYLVYDSPGQHPRISESEKERVLSETGAVSRREHDSTPWLKIFTSLPVWAILVADVSLQFNINIVLNELPSYMGEVLGFNIKHNGWLSGLPYFATYFVAVLCTYIADKWQKSGKFSTIAIRKGFTMVAFWIPNVLLLIQVFWGYDAVVSVFVFTLSQGFFSAATAGFISNSMDIAPAYAGTVFGLAFTGGASTGYISSKLVAVLVTEKGSFQQWSYVFWVLIAINFVGSIFYWIFASADVQDWNRKTPNEVELKMLNREEQILNKALVE